MTRSNQRRMPKRSLRPVLHRWSKPAFHWGISLLLITGVVAGAWWLNTLASISQWQIQASPEIRQQLDVELQAMENLDFIHSRPETLKTILMQQIPDIASMTIQRKLPDTLLITAKPRQRVALWQNDEGSIYLVDINGQAFRLRRASESTNLPILRISQDKLSDSTQLLLKMKRRWPEWYNATSEVFAEGSGWKINLSHQQQWRVPFGSRAWHDIDVMTRLLKTQRWSQQYWRINTRLGDRWFFRPAQQGGLV